ncbi:ubiquinol-cytochrome C reductase [Enemella dayhoffiae]|uniref:Cytochrome bc1 complex Rieske iron-sulfur subunit n=1 Tax=Enemella dayhoffiae TaxID=2016507 RepID=A0A255HBJ3_9ACTN|nr:Rieske 2Fe-2S domain-containing protein [Enemella dayhoffiae]OYO24716.1 ubiquinol-cytochrome C reductase [Enemella dayhoffiae]
MIDDPGLEEHVERYTDVDDAAAARATRQIVACFAAAPLLALAFIVIYFWPGLRKYSIEFGFIHANAQHVGLGLTLGLAVLLIGIGAVQWAREIMGDHEITEERHVASSSDADRRATMAEVDKGIAESGLSRRAVIGRSLLGAIGLTALAPLVTLADLGPWPLPSTRKRTIERTLWHEASAAKPVRLVNDVTWQPIKASAMQIGQLVNAEPANLEKLHGPEFQTEKAKSAIIIVRMDPNSIKIPERRKDWHVAGIMAYSKICTHVGCPISLWEQQTHHLLCPCHQSTFDLGDGGKVVFGPAARALPQLKITVDNEGYLVATQDFTAPVGPSYPERDWFPDDEGE